MHLARTDETARAAAIVDDNGLAERLPEGLGKQAPKNVRVSTGREGHDHADARTGERRLRISWGGQQSKAGRSAQDLTLLHGFFLLTHSPG
jgi:hypothetical protein